MAQTFKVELANLLETQRDLERVARELHGAPMLTAMRDATLIVTADAKRLATVDTGRYRASITPEVRAEGETVVGIVGSNLQYAPFTVLGRKPGKMPPIAAIQEWVHRKGVGATARGGGRISRAPASVERGIAFLIARRIARHGTKGDQSLIKAVEQNAGRIADILDRAVGKVVG